VARGALYATNLASRKVQILPKVEGETAGLAFDPASARLYVADAAGDRIWVLELRPSPMPPKSFAAGHGLSEPRGLALDASGNLWVVNKGNGALLSFDKSGKLLARF